jgi:hypothetical protein
VSSLRYDIQVQQGDGAFKSISNRAGCGATSLSCSLTKDELLREFKLKPGQLITARGRAGVSRGWGMTGIDNYSGLSLLGNPNAFFRAPSVVLVGNSGATVNWTSRSNGSDSVTYKVEQSLNGVADNTNRSTGGSFLTYNNLSVEVEYCYRVKAVATCGENNFSKRSCI